MTPERRWMFFGVLKIIARCFCNKAETVCLRSSNNVLFLERMNSGCFVSCTPVSATSNRSHASLDRCKWMRTSRQTDVRNDVVWRANDVLASCTETPTWWRRNNICTYAGISAVAVIADRTAYGILALAGVIGGRGYNWPPCPRPCPQLPHRSPGS